MKDPKAQTDEEMDSLALMLEIAPRLAVSYRIKNDFLKVMHPSSSQEAKPALVDCLTEITQLTFLSLRPVPGPRTTGLMRS